MVALMKAPAPGSRLPFGRGSVEYCLGTEADHEAVYQTLLHVFQGPDRESFLGALSDPAYRPDQRLLAKVDGRVVSHIHLTEHVRYGSVSIPINGVMWVGTLPEFRGMGFAQNLMRLASERAARVDSCSGVDDGHAAVLPASEAGSLRAADVRSGR
jgi:predicted N-acetyltransferase YhbS